MIMEILVLLIMGILLIYKSRKSLHMLQQNLYNENNRYIKWIIKNKGYLVNIEIFAIFLIAIGLFVTFDFETYFIIVMFLISFLYAIQILFWTKNKAGEQTKKPLVITARIKRLIVTTSILYLIPVVLLLFCYDSMKSLWLYLFIISIMLYLNLFVVLLARIINTPVEKCVYFYYLNKAKSTLRDRKNLKIIGITGSYGKTSSKNVLGEILNIKYNALPTPKNLNTPYGLMITINNHLDKFTDVFIAEMGAYKKGEIKDLCGLVHPKYGIITVLGKAHLESFGSEENIKQGKMELIESLPKDGLGVLNGDDYKQIDYVKTDLKNDVPLKWIGIENEDVDVRAVNIKCSHKGTSFDVVFKGDKTKYPFETKLLGSYSVYNILAAIALGREFDIEISDLQKAVSLVKAVEHRLELKRLGNFYQIDDAYNSNPVGAKAAVKILGMMPGTKVVVTPGMVELGEKEDEYNREFGRQIAEVADYVCLIGEKKSRPIKEGLKEAGFKDKNIIVYNDVKEAYKFINGLTASKKDVYALFENDLPDTYNE